MSASTKAWSCRREEANDSNTAFSVAQELGRGAAAGLTPCCRSWKRPLFGPGEYGIKGI